jgi:3-phosphoshikimate 1-carboxyvinyltransferase
MPRNDRKQTPRKPSPTQDLIDLDRKLTDMLVRRCDLLARSASERRERRGKIAEPHQEKALWAVWKERRDESGVDGRIWEQIFNLSNGLAYARAEREQRRHGGYVLSPKRAPVAIDLPGPRDLLTSRFALTLAAVSGQPLVLPDVVLNDPMIELIKGFNQIGGAVSWDGMGVRSDSTSGLGLEGKVVFAGSDRLNLFILLALSLTTTGTFKITGGARLKTTDLTPLRPVLLQLGARVVHLDPHSLGVPLRVEASGVIPTEVRLPETCPVEFAWALLLALSALSRPLRIRWLPEAGKAILSGRVAHLLDLCGCAYERHGDGIELKGSGPELPTSISVPLDPQLSGFVLALPLGPGGRSRLRGTWPGFGEDDGVSRLLGRFLNLSIGAEEISTTPGDIRSAQSPPLEHSPLAAALALLRQARDPGYLASFQPEGEWGGPAVLTELGVSTSLEEGLLKLSWADEPGGKPPTIDAPTPEWAMALALLSFHRPGMTLLNPGIVSQSWPQFWQIFNGLPNPSEARAQDKEMLDEPKRRRRIIS